MRDLVEYYRVLELEYQASLENIKQAYKDLATVWHPDRFSDNPRLQQKAEEKLKAINEAYEKLRRHYLNNQSQSAKPTSGSERPQSYTASEKRQTKPREPHCDPKLDRRQYDLMISLQQAKSILAKYKFKQIKILPGFCAHYESDPFDLDVKENIPEVVLSVPCTSISTFHQVLLSIPCKSTGMFHQLEAQELIQLLKANLDWPSK